jgi:hypothetical protein
MSSHIQKIEELLNDRLKDTEWYQDGMLFEVTVLEGTDYLPKITFSSTDEAELKLAKEIEERCKPKVYQLIKERDQA